MLGRRQISSPSTPTAQAPAERCNWCLKPGPDSIFRKCKTCQLVRYCSRGCERAAMKTHKAHCTSTQSISDDPETKQLVENLNTWLTYWRAQIFNYAWNCVDLPNNPPDRLATHIVFIELEPRENPPSPQQFFKMRGGDVVSRGKMKEMLRELDFTEKEITEWAADERGPNTVHICLWIGNYLRELWLTMSDLSVLRNVDKAKSAQVAEVWADALEGLIEDGNLYTGKSDI